MPTDREIFPLVLSHLGNSPTGRCGPWQLQHTSTLRLRKKGHSDLVPMAPTPPSPFRPVPSRHPTVATLRFVCVQYSVSHVVPCYILPFFGVPRPNQRDKLLLIVLSSGDRKSWTGSRSRTLAPPRGAAWIVKRSGAVERKMNQMPGTHFE
jgi:hypothetical protein